MIADRYTLEREIGRGGMGAVWLGRDELLGRRVALKRVGAAPGGTDPELARAEREARLAASLSHANVVSVFDLAHDGDDQWLVMEYVEGTDLAALVRDHGALSPDQAGPILAQVASALVAAHAAGVVHRDVKPSNILLTHAGQVKLSDFGIARTKTDAVLTRTGLVTGSPAYLSPEVASGRSASDKSDVWSLGTTAYHAIEGHPPYEVGDNLIGALYRIVHEDPPRPAAPGWLAPLFDGCLQQDETSRWDARQVEQFLRAGPSASPPPPGRTRRHAVRVGSGRAEVRGGGTQVLAPVSRSTRTVPADDRRQRRSRLPMLLGALAILLVLVLVYLAWTILGGDGQQPGTTVDAPSPSPTLPTQQAPSAPTSRGMTRFVTDYVTTAPTDPDTTFALLTPQFQDESNGLDGYTGFWSNVTDVELGPVQADPDDLTVSYQYSFRFQGRQRNENVTLQLTFENGQYRVAGDLS